jgi:DNA polymerase-4
MEEAFLDVRGLERIAGSPPRIAERLRAAGVDTVGDIARTPETSLVAIVGGHAGRRLLAIATDRDFRPVRSGRRRRSYGAQRALGLHRYRRGEVEPTLDALVDRVTRRMRTAHRVGRTVILRMRFGDYTRATRSATLTSATAESRPIKLAARGLLEAAREVIDRRGLTMVGITVTNVEPDGCGTQLRLPVGRPIEALDAALDELRERYGSGAITRATNIDRNPQLAADLLAGEAADRTRPGSPP